MKLDFYSNYIKKTLSVFLLISITCIAFPQAPSKKCPSCGLSMAKCQYKGKHPKKNLVSSNSTPAKGLSGNSRKNSTKKTVIVTITPEMITIGQFHEGHYYVDLGLPSGTLWATCNIGADSPLEWGDYYAWGETESKTEFSLENYLWRDNRTNVYYCKYCLTPTKQNRHCFDDRVDNIMELELEDDAAFFNWGGKWRIPTMSQYLELINKAYVNLAMVTCNQVKGLLVTSKKNGNSIFFPAAGESSCGGNWHGFYWSKTLWEHCCHANMLVFHLPSEIDEEFVGAESHDFRYLGLSIRPVLIK